MSVRTSLTIGAALLAAFPALAADQAQQRQEIRRTCSESLEMLKKVNPPAAAAVSRGAGYGCFANMGLTFIFGGAGGSGLVHDNATGRDYYMHQAQVSVGPVLEVKRYREILVFSRRDVLDNFVNSGWELTGGGGATAKLEGKGGDLEGAGAARRGIDVYPMTSTGLAFGGAVGARKYWLNGGLNGPRA
jgi:lipid-binding SYLF domain-containing protein